jgi:cytochrome c oxidase assembly protein subunit 15
MAGHPNHRTATPAPSAFPVWRHRFAVLTCACTLALIFIGGLVTSTGSGLAVPDWPLSYGMLMPPMVGGVFYEHGHRLAAATVGFLTLILALWTWRKEPRRAVRRLAWAALGVVILQGLLGGITVILLLPTAVSVLHACLAQAFFCLTVALAYATSREWLAAGPPAEDAAGLRPLSAVATALVFVQLLLGALMRHTGAGLAIPDFPLAFGRLLPPLEHTPVIVHFAHRLGAVVALTGLLALFAAARRSRDPRFVRPAAALLILAGVQVALGATAVLTGKAVVPTTAHVAAGAALLGGCFFLGLRARRHLRRSQKLAVLATGVPDTAAAP